MLMIDLSYSGRSLESTHVTDEAQNPTFTKITLLTISSRDLQRRMSFGVQKLENLTLRLMPE